MYVYRCDDVVAISVVDDDDLSIDSVRTPVNKRNSFSQNTLKLKVHMYYIIYIEKGIYVYRHRLYLFVYI
jgi:hypothetical protein